MRTVKTVSTDKLKKDINLLLRLLLVYKRVTVVDNDKIQFVAINPNRKVIAQELFG